MRGFNIIDEDTRLIILNKQPGLLTIPDPSGAIDLSTLVNDFFHQRDGHGAINIHPCHRLDRDTSGLIVYAKGKANQKMIMECFAQRLTSKIYLCVVNGLLGPDRGVCKQSLDGKSALTQYQVLYRGSNYSLLKCKIHTGRTNQIRLHCAAMGHPLVGDDRFGKRRDFAFNAKRTLLHSWYLSLPPLGDAPARHWLAPLPEDMATLFAPVTSLLVHE
jgi:23S rRNA pseudouridine1911/1915/1917 synthase